MNLKCNKEGERLKKNGKENCKEKSVKMNVNVLI